MKNEEKGLLRVNIPPPRLRLLKYVGLIYKKGLTLFCPLSPYLPKVKILSTNHQYLKINLVYIFDTTI